MQLLRPGMVWCLQYYLDHDQKLKKFVPIIHNSIVYPVVLDANGTVASLPPVINGAHSAVSPVSAPDHCWQTVCKLLTLATKHRMHRTATHWMNKTERPAARHTVDVQPCRFACCTVASVQRQWLDGLQSAVNTFGSSIYRNLLIRVTKTHVTGHKVSAIDTKVEGWTH